MAIVGTAFVRLKVIGDTLKKDLSKSVHDAIVTNPEIEKAGEEVGAKITDGVEKHMSGGTNGFDKVADDIGNAIGRAMGANLNRTLGSRLKAPFAKAFRDLKPEISKAGTDLSNSFKTFKDGVEKQSKKIKGVMFAGISQAVIALPSLLSGAGAVIGAYAATAITALSTIGPAVAGGAIAGIAALSALKITAGLVGLAMKTVTPQLEDFKKRSEAFKVTLATPVQAGLLAGLNGSMRVLNPVIKTLNDQLVGTGVAVGGVALGFANMLAQGPNVARLGTILTNNNSFVTQAGAGITGFGQALVILLAHLGPVLDYLGSGLQQLGQWAANAMAAAEASGSLDGFISRMFGSLTYFVGILVDFGTGIANVFRAAYGASGGMLTNLHDMAASFAAWTGDPANQDRMTAFFEKMRTIVAQVDGILGKLVGGSLKALEGTNVDSLSRGLGTLASLGPPLAQMFNAIKDAAGGNLQVSLQNFADIITQLANSGVIGILSGALSNLLAIISQVLALPGVGTILSFVAGLAVMLKTVGLVVNVLKLLGPAFKLIWAVGGILVDIIGALVAAFGAIPLIIAAVVAGLVYFFAFTDTGRAIVKAAWDAIVAAVQAAWDFLVGAFQAIQDAFGAAIDWIVSTAQGFGSSILGALSGAWNAVVAGVTTAWNAVVAAVSTALSAVVGVIVGVWNSIVGFITPIATTIYNVISGVFNGIWTVVSTILNAILAFWTAVFIIMLIPIRVFEGVVILIWQGLVALIGWAMGLISSLVTTVWNAIWGFITMVMGAIGNAISVAWNWMVGIISTALSAIWNFITTIWNAVWGFIVGIVSAIAGYVSAGWNLMVGYVSAGMSAVWGVITSIWNSVSGFINGVLNTIKGFIASAWAGISNQVSNAMSTVQNTITSVWNSITGFLRGAMSTIQGIVGGIWNALSSAGGNVVGGLKSAVNGVIGVVNSAIGGINSMISIANKLPGVDIPTISRIPALAKGGVVSPTSGGTLALVAEAGRKERVEPLDSDGLSKRDRAILNQFSLAAGSGSGANVNVYLGTRELMELVDVVVEEREDALAGAVSTGRKG